MFDPLTAIIDDLAEHGGAYTLQRGRRLEVVRDRPLGRLAPGGIMTTPQPGDVWLDSRPMTDRPEWRDKTRFRRVVRVTAFEAHGWAEGKSSWQERKRGHWADMEFPPPRTTRILAVEFLRRFARIED
jgi:hypothetical protein